MFRHPKYYTELRKRNKEAGLSVEVSKASSEISLTSNRLKSDQVISSEVHDGARERALDPGLKQQAQASSAKPQAPSESNNKLQAPSPKHEASSSKPQASSSKILEPGNI